VRTLICMLQIIICATTCGTTTRCDNAIGQCGPLYDSMNYVAQMQANWMLDNTICMLLTQIPQELQTKRTET